MLTSTYFYEKKEYKVQFFDTTTYEEYEKVIQSYGICFTKKGKVMIGKYPGGKWVLPGGTIEKNETAEETLIREVNEEVSITLNRFELIGVQRVDNITENEFYCHQLRFVCLIEDILELTEDPSCGKKWERRTVDPEEVFTKYIDWPNVGPHLMKRAIEIFNSWKK